MARYFFHFHDGAKFVDLKGTELPDLASARHEALRFAAALLTERPDEFWNAKEWTVRVTDADHLTIFTLLFMATDAPVAQGIQPNF